MTTTAEEWAAMSPEEWSEFVRRSNEDSRRLKKAFGSVGGPFDYLDSREAVEEADAYYCRIGEDVLKGMRE